MISMTDHWARHNESVASKLHKIMIRFYVPNEYAALSLIHIRSSFLFTYRRMDFFLQKNDTLESISAILSCFKQKFLFRWCSQCVGSIGKYSYPLLQLILSDFSRILAIQLLAPLDLDAEQIFFFSSESVLAWRTDLITGIIHILIIN